MCGIALETAGMSPKEVLRQFGVHKLDTYWGHHAEEVKTARLFFKHTHAVLATLRRSMV
jgi:hypothetical protein